MKPINIKGLSRYSISQEGRVFLGEKEIKGIWLDENTYHFPLYSSNCRQYPESFTLETLYEKTFHKPPAKRIKAGFKPKQSRREYREIVLRNPQREKITFPSLRYAAKFLGVSEKRAVYCIEHRLTTKGFEVIGLGSSPFPLTEKCTT